LNNNDPFASRTEREVDAFADLRRRRPYLFWFVLFFLIIMFSLYVYEKFWGIPKLKEKKEDLSQLLVKKEAEIQRLELLLVPFRTVALQWYKGSEAESLKKLANRIIEIESDLSALKDYGEVATLGFLGYKSLGGIAIGRQGPMAGWANGYLTKNIDGTYDIKCEPEALNHYRQMIIKYPYYPFPLYPLAICLKLQGDDAWRDYAKEAVRILEKTTLVPSRNASHDDILKQIKQLLEE